MRGYVWYSPESDSIAIQWFLEGCSINFEHSHDDLFAMHFAMIDEPMNELLWIALGEL